MSKFLAVAHLQATEGSAGELRQCLLDLFALAREEPGTLQWDLAESADDPGSFTITETFADEASYLIHEENPETAKVSARMGPLMAKVEVWHGPVIAGTT